MPFTLATDPLVATALTSMLSEEMVLPISPPIG
jgi:hypothetical protein